MVESFILQDVINDISICDNLIKFYQESSNKKPGTTAYKIDETIKKSTDIDITEIEFTTNKLIYPYLEYLNIIGNKYINKYKYADSNVPFGIIEQIKIQHYKPNEGYFGWHHERNASNLNGLLRHLVFMTYLNDVDDSGETEFYYQQLKIKPKKGLTLVWPAEWTHTHRGITSPTQDKFIITGWFSYIT